MARQTLQQWIHEALTDQDKKGKCSMLVLIHRVGVKEQEIHKTDLGARQWDTKELAEMFRGKAENYAAELVGVQTFNLLAFYGGDPEPQAIKPFMVNGQEDFGGLATEAPTKDGLLQQMMRHVEAERQIGAKQVQQLIQACIDLTAVATKENISLRAENREMFDMTKMMMMREVESREAARMKELEFQRASAERQKWLSFAPAIVNRIFGKEVVPESLEDTALIETLAEKLTEQDIQKLASAGISPEAWGPFAARMSGLLQRKRLAAEQARSAMNGVDPEEDATGIAPHERRLAS